MIWKIIFGDMENILVRFKRKVSPSSNETKGGRGDDKANDGTASTHQGVRRDWRPRFVTAHYVPAIVNHCVQAIVYHCVPAIGCRFVPAFVYQCVLLHLFKGHS